MIYAFGDSLLDTNRYELHVAGKLQPIEPQVFDLLRYLIENRDRVVTRDELLQEIWSGRIVSDSALTSRIKAARKAIGASCSFQPCAGAAYDLPGQSRYGMVRPYPINPGRLTPCRLPTLRRENRHWRSCHS
jgi:DNA-binding response OmpR family regulator